MVAFVVERLNALRGRGVRSGVWEFEELMLADSLQARAVVEYRVEWCNGRVDVAEPRCTVAEVFDDLGEIIILNDEERLQVATAAVDAFDWVRDTVREFEHGLRNVVPVR